MNVYKDRPKNDSSVAVGSRGGGSNSIESELHFFANLFFQ